MINHEPESVLASYEATVTTGLESIAKEEADEKLGVNATTQKGRIWFSSTKPVKEILKLKSICNLFVVIYNKNLETSEIPPDSDSLESFLTPIGEQCDWKTGLVKWNQINSVRSFNLNELFQKDPDLREKQPMFRVSCNRYGPEHKFTSPEICSVFGHVVDTKFGWPIKMKDYDLEVMVTFSENHLYVGLTLTPLALDRRNIISTGLTTLRAATCYALLRTAKIQCADIVVDPMSGSGAIPVECCASWINEWLAYTIAGELKRAPIEKCKTNLSIFRTGQPYEVLQLDVTAMPFREGSIDVFVSDLPFGRRHGTKKLNRTLYPALLQDMARVARLRTARAVLLTQDFKSMNLANDKNRHLWIQKLCSFVKIGNLNCYIYLFLRSDKKFELNCDPTEKSRILNID